MSMPFALSAFWLQATELAHHPPAFKTLWDWSLQVLQKLRNNIEAGSFYEAHEMFKTVYHRYRSRKQLEDSYRLAEVCGGLAVRLCWGRSLAAGHAEHSISLNQLLPYCLLLLAFHLAGQPSSCCAKRVPCLALCLQEGAKIQLEKGQLNCGVELAMLLVEVRYPATAASQKIAAGWCLPELSQLSGAFLGLICVFWSACYGWRCFRLNTAVHALGWAGTPAGSPYCCTPPPAGLRSR